MADIARLPRWAQMHIQKLEADLAYANEQISRVLGEPIPGYPCYGDYGSEHYGKSLPCRSVDWPEAGIYIRAQDDQLIVHGREGYLNVRPGAANVVYLGLSKR